MKIQFHFQNIKLEGDIFFIFSEIMANSIKRSGYNCCYSGCSWSGKRHTFYIEHISRVHFLNKNILCNFAKKCLERFDSIQSLQLHVKRYHHRQSIQKFSSTARKQNSNLSILTPTHCTLCTKIFRSTKLLMTHFNTFHSSETRPCIFKNCSTVFSPFAESRHHFLKSHKKKGDLDLKPEFVIFNEAPRIDNEERQNTCDSGDDFDSDTGSIVTEGEDERDSEEVDDASRASEKENFLKVLCDFYNKLSHTETPGDSEPRPHGFRRSQHCCRG